MQETTENAHRKSAPIISDMPYPALLWGSINALPADSGMRKRYMLRICQTVARTTGGPNAWLVSMGPTAVVS